MITLEKAKEAADILVEFYGETRKELTREERLAIIKTVDILDTYRKSTDPEIPVVLDISTYCKPLV